MRFLVLALVVGCAVVEHPRAPWGPRCAHAQVLAAQAPGNPDHNEPAKDFFCSHTATKAAERCACHRTCHKDENGKVDGVTRDVACKSDCYEKHCHCGVECDVI